MVAVERLTVRQLAVQLWIEGLALDSSAQPGRETGYHSGEQLPSLRISRVEFTGSGFFADFDTPDEVPLAEPPNFAGGDADIHLARAAHAAGCVLHVRNGRIATFEGHMKGDEAWPEDTVVLSFDEVVPVFRR
jgi:hypothetical protein